MVKNRNKYSLVLMAAIFATGFSGIVAEYLLSTLATYFLGDSILQWTLIVSTMLFSMGLGSRISKRFETQLVTKFLLIEFILSLVVSFAPLLVYTLAAFSSSLSIIIYGFSIAIGVLIGMEIPIVIRINQGYEELRVNISNVLEKDYYGSLLGGVFFAFIGIPILGIKYTPFFLGFVNLSVAFFVLFYLKDFISSNMKNGVRISALGSFLVLTVGLSFANPIIEFGEQRKYKDKIVYTEQTKYQRIVITQWIDNYWLYLNGNEQLSTVDEVMYHEPLVHPAMTLHPKPRDILVLGGGDGCAVREIIKYKGVNSVTLVDLDPAMTRLGRQNPILTSLNDSSLYNPKVSVVNKDGFTHLQNNKQYYDIIIVDLPDPRTVELGRLYTEEFYKLCHRFLRPNGILITQAGSPYFATRAFKCIVETMKSAGFNTVPLHNHVITLGEWGWSFGVKCSQEIDVKKNLKKLRFDSIKANWITQDAMSLMTSFGKDIFSGREDSVKVNRIHDPVLYKYYLKGNWDLY